MSQVISILRWMDNLLGQMAKILTAVTIFIQMLVMFAGVCFRYFLKSPLTWSDELSSYLLVLVTFFGAYVALRSKELARIELFISMVPAKLRKPISLIATILVLVLLAAIIYYGAMLVMSPTILKQRTPAMQLPMAWFYTIIPVAAAMMSVHLIVAMYDTLLEERNR
ncbi:Tripartite ATP-independent periplasmic transporter, DctQ component [Moorella glycerini]|uniref:Sialic acid TRAP transporter permease protein SiaT n=1 Tax=Neomoorella stamsii TaxID=1266720 RepID=A0A9X7J4D7_9FIRM|nr:MULTISPECIES: TRAP transporter small permease [Moorella]PRR75648.1 Sialic acid TRAP transporter permease protein SiaT [Moorella stamsii]CEP66504.1 Tripartite ATP-independent periplasmic transporter, DctQ component [Moorella glycerini]